MRRHTISICAAILLPLLTIANVVESSIAAKKTFYISGQTASYTASDYIQDGLCLMFDGIENAGWNQHVDSTNVWTDLVDGFIMMTANNNIVDFSSGCAKHGKHLSMYNGSGDPVLQQGNRYYSKMIALRQAMNSGKFTVEVVCSAYVAGLTSWEIQNYDVFAIGLFNSAASLSLQIDGNVLLYKGILADGSSKFMIQPFPNDGILFSRSVVLDKDYGIIDGYANGRFIASSQLSQTIVWNGADNVPLLFLNSCIGNSKYRPLNDWNVAEYMVNYADSITDTYCIRIYSRVLSPDEVAYNFQIDKSRFKLK